jgi:hypothetical protein
MKNAFIIKGGNIAKKIKFYEEQLAHYIKESETKLSYTMYDHYHFKMSHCTLALIILTDDKYGEGIYRRGFQYKYKYDPNAKYAREERWDDRRQWISYLEATESQASSKIDSVTQIVENKDLSRFIADYL